MSQSTPTKGEPSLNNTCIITKELPTRSIIGGDLLCWEPNIRCRHLPKSTRRTHENGYASDIFYKIHGNRATTHTNTDRETAEIRTRLIDRIYTKDTKSRLAWHSHELDHTYANYVDSDRIAVIVLEAGPLGESKSKKTRKGRKNTIIHLRHENKNSQIITQEKIPSTNPYAGGKGGNK